MLDILELLRAKGRQLEEYKITPTQSRLETLASNSLALVSALGIVLRHTSKIHYLMNTPSVHPYHAFCALRELASELTLFFPGLSALGENLNGDGKALSSYDHLDPYPCFWETRNMIARLLDAITPGPEITLVFQKDGRDFLVKLPPQLDNNYLFWLSIRSGTMPPDQIRAYMSAYGKIASPERLQHLISYNLPGVGITPLRDAPVGLSRRNDTVYFAIRQKDPLWEEAIKSKALALFWDSAPEDAVATLTGNSL
jgi:type VI secretion system protein ImpJ